MTRKRRGRGVKATGTSGNKWCLVGYQHTINRFIRNSYFIQEGRRGEADEEARSSNRKYLVVGS